MRKTLRMSQQAFASELEISVGSVRAYEAGARLSDGALEKLKSLAARKMLPDYAIALDGRQFEVRQVFAPGGKVRLPRNPGERDLGDDLHRLLDEVLESGNVEAVNAVESVLQICASVVAKAAGHPRRGSAGKTK
ncbi:MAG TPA: hypothetical protein VGL82_00695 [Bryobacteraceae bacterium]